MPFIICSRILSSLLTLKSHLSALVCSLTKYSSISSWFCCADANSSRSIHLFGFWTMFASKILNTFSELSFCSVVRSAFLIKSRPFGPELRNLYHCNNRLTYDPLYEPETRSTHPRLTQRTVKTGISIYRPRRSSNAVHVTTRCYGLP